MKKTIFLLSMLIAARNLSSQVMGLTAEDIKRMMDTLIYSSKQVFIGQYQKLPESYQSANGGIYTRHLVAIKSILSGDLQPGSVEVFTDGGTYGDITIKAWDNVELPSEYFIFFGRDAESAAKPPSWNSSNNRGMRLFDAVGFKGDEILHPAKGSGNLFQHTGEYLAYLQAFYGYTNTWNYLLSARPAIPNTNGETVEKIDNSKNPENFLKFTQLLKEKRQAAANSNTANKTTNVSAVGDLNFTMGASYETGTNPRYLEFDVSVSATNAGYLDNGGVLLKYSTLAFGNNIVANNKITVTSYAPFNNASYYNVQNFMNDHQDTVYIAIGTITQSNRGAVGPTPVPILHVKMQIASCYQNANIAFGDPLVANNYGSFAPTANASWGACSQFDHTNFSGSLTQVLCDVNLTDFTWPIHAGIGDILTITGSNFGSTKGTGKVSFANADGGSYINDLNAVDYVSWSNTQIKIRLPHHVDSLIGLTGIGGGTFKVTNNAGDYSYSNLNVAGHPFEIYYSIINEDRVVSNSLKKYRVNLIRANSSGGYTIRANPNDFPIGSARRGCLIRAIRDWKCLTGANLTLGPDTLITNPVLNQVDGFNYFWFNSNTSVFAAGELARTINAQGTCANNSGVRFGAKQEFDMMFNASFTWYPDTTGATVPLGQMDLYGVLLHELGHVVGLGHTSNDPSELMTWTGGVPGVRKVLNPSSGASDGGTYNVNASATQMAAIGTNTCGILAHVPQNLFICTPPPGTGIYELSNAVTDFLVYPNPIGDHFIINYTLNDNKDLSFKLIDVTGRELLNYKPNNSNIGFHQDELNSSDFPTGIYLLFIQVQGKSKTVKLIK